MSFNFTGNIFCSKESKDGILWDFSLSFIQQTLLSNCSVLGAGCLGSWETGWLQPSGNRRRVGRQVLVKSQLWASCAEAVPEAHEQSQDSGLQFTSQLKSRPFSRDSICLGWQLCRRELACETEAKNSSLEKHWRTTYLPFVWLFVLYRHEKLGLPFGEERPLLLRRSRKKSGDR